MIEKAKIEEEIKKYLSKYEIQNCSLSICEYNIDSLNQEINKLSKNCCYFTEDEIYFLYILYIEDTNEVLWIDVNPAKRSKFKETLEDIISKHKNIDKIRMNICIDLYVFKDNAVYILLDIVKSFKVEINYQKKKQKNKIKKLEDRLFEIPILGKPWECIKKLLKFIINPPIVFTMIFVIYVTYYYTFLSKIGITPDILNESTLIKTIEITLIYFITSFVIVISWFLSPTILLTTLIASLLISISIITIKMFFRERKKEVYIFILKNFTKRDFIFTFFNFFPKTIVSISVMMIILALIAEPLYFILKDAGFPKILINPIKKIKINTKYPLLSKLRLINSDLRFKEVNGKFAFVIGSKNDFLYYYELNDLIKINIEILFPVLKEREKIQDYCSAFESFDKRFKEQNDYLNSLISYIETNKNKKKKVETAKEYLQGIITREKLFYALFLMPTFYEVYPLEYIQEKIQKRSILSKAKIGNIDDNVLLGYLHCLEAMCKIYTQNNLNKNKNI